MTTHRSRVLVIDEEPSTRRALRSILSGDGAAVEEAATLAEAKARLLDVEWVVLDLFLGKGQAGELLRYIQYHRLAVKVAVAAGGEEGEWMEEAAKTSPEILLARPVSLRRLVGLLRKKE